MDAMRVRVRQSLCSLLLSMTLIFGGTAAAQDSHAGHGPAAAHAAPAAMKRMRWSDPAAWPGGKVPGEGDAVTIARDKDIVLDVSPPALRSLTIEGKLSFADDRDLELQTVWIYVPGGELEIGSEARPHTRQATIMLTDKVP